MSEKVIKFLIVFHKREATRTYNGVSFSIPKICNNSHLALA